MQLYVTTTSERAQKGQGGNKFVTVSFEVEHESAEREIMLVLSIVRVGDEFRIVESGTGEVWHTLPVKK